MNFSNLREKIGQLFFIGIPSTVIDDTTEDFLNLISPGGVCLFSRNIRTADGIRQLNDDLRKILQNPIIAVDQEGGLVDRLRRIITPMPSVKELTEKGSDKSIEDFAAVTANILRLLGFNTNFAPVVDVVDDKRDKYSNGLQSRAFGNSVRDVLEMSEVYLKSLQANGCLGTIKHFPGIGAIQVDSHDELPVVSLSEKEFEEIDLLPYKTLITKKIVRAVMVGHAAFPNLALQEKDSAGKLLPSSLSQNFITSLLREQLNFKGLVISDDLEMGAVLKNYSIGEICIRTIKAGVDMPLICASQEAVKEGFETVCEAVQKGEISENRIDQSLERISTFKNLLSDPLPFDSGSLSELSGIISEIKSNLA